jgi:hypothetical protein
LAAFFRLTQGFLHKNPEQNFRRFTAKNKGKREKEKGDFASLFPFSLSLEKQ